MDRNPTQSPPQGSWRRRYRVYLSLARAALTWERLWPCLWPAVGVAVVFLSVALMDWLPLLPFWAHSLALIAFAVAFGFLVRGAVAEFKVVDETAAQHRLEQDSGLDHRPLAALHDRLAGGIKGADSEALWQVHLRRMAERARRLKVLLPSPGLARRDPYGLRAVALLLLVIAAATGGSDAVGRLERALLPQLGSGAAGPLDLNIWITPPAYTGLAPIFLERPPQVAAATPPDEGTDAGEGEPALAVVTVPVGSSLLAQAGGARYAPQLLIGDRTIQFAAIDASEKDRRKAGGDTPGKSYRLETTLEDADRAADSLEVRLGPGSSQGGIARWPMRIVADAPPKVEFTRAPARAGRAQLHLEYEATDDYGLAGLQVVIRHPDGLAVPGGEATIRAELALPGLGSTRTKGSSLQDFSAHPWAGIPVLVRLQAMDARGQAGESDDLTIVLPERIFNHPVARAIAEARKKLNTPSYKVIEQVVEDIGNIANRPQHFFDDTVVFLALSVAANRLIHDGSPASVGGVQTLLWETALRIEDGKFAIAERDLKALQERLANALRNNADAKEIERLLDDLQQALDKYLAALAEHLQKQGLTQLPLDPNARTMDSSDLQRMIEQARNLARTGSREAARQMLSQLKRMLDGIRNGMQRGKPSKEMAKAQKMMDTLRKLTQRQRQALDRTFERKRQAEDDMNRGARPSEKQGGKQGEKQGDIPGSQGQGKNGSAEQQALRRALGKLMLEMDEFLGGIPNSFGKAERAMKDAIGPLDKGQFDKAVPSQTEALNQLQKGANSMAEQMARRMGSRMGISQGQRGLGQRGQQGRQPGRREDPFGRTPGGTFGEPMDDGGVKIPDQMESRRALDILQELRRRAGERERPTPELDYIDRLLKRF
ncbi:MAG: TIGR02302 family protein [Proteobacteria bacterium]|nr:TIGR02302 family protein [Pseudomonadota bacterium]